MDDRDRRLKEIEKAGAIEGASLAQNEIASMAQEQKSNLLQEKQALMQQSQERALMSQAAEMGVGAVADMTQQQASSAAQAPAMNAQTQELLSKYGINPNQKTSPKSSTVTRSTTKQGSTVIENITNTTTTNHNVVRVIQPNIPISKPNIAMKDGAVSNAKFKSWLQQANARQEELSNSQMNEYNRRERDLSRSTDRMMRKLKDLSSTISRNLDPENMTNTISGSLKTLLFLYISSMLPIVWRPMMRVINALEADFRRFFGLPMPPGLEEYAVGSGKSKVTSWKLALGMKGDLDSQSIFSGVKGLISSAFDRLMKELELQKEDRKKAISRVQKDKPKKLTDFSGWLNYLGKIIVASVGGTEAQAIYSVAPEVIKEEVKEIEQEEFELEGKKISMLGEFDEEGNLRNEDSALKLTQSIANETTKDTVDVSKIQASVEKLKKFSTDQNKLVPLSPEFVKKISEIVPEDKIKTLIEKYQEKGEYKINKDDYIYTIRKSDYDPSTQYSIWDRVKEWASTGGAAGAAAGAVAGAAPTAGFGIVAGGAIGHVLGTVVGGGVGLVHGISDGISAYFKDPGGQLSLVPLNTIDEKDKRNLNFHKNYSKAIVEEVSPEFLSELLGMAETDKSSFSSKNYIGLTNTLTSKGKKIDVNKEYKEVISDTQKLDLKREELAQENTQFNNALNKYKERKSLPTIPLNEEPVDSSVKDSSTPKQNNPEESAKKADVKVKSEEKENIARRIINYLKQKLGLTTEQASGVAGNLYVESGFDSQAKGDRGKAYGLAQWRDSRRENLKDYSGKEPSNLDQQLEFVAHELNTTEKGALKELKAQSTVKDSAMSFAKRYERPATGADGLPLHFDRRWGYAHEFYQKVSGQFIPQQTASVSTFTSTTTPESPTSNMTVSEIKKDEDPTKYYLNKIAESTKQLADVTNVSAQLDAIPRQQNITVNQQTPQTQVNEGTGFTTPT